MFDVVHCLCRENMPVNERIEDVFACARTSPRIWRKEMHRKWCDRHECASVLSLEQRRVALYMLVCEAYRRDMGRKAGVEVRKQWNTIWRKIAQDMKDRDNSPFVMKNLGEMCIFEDDGPIDYEYNGISWRKTIRELESTKIRKLLLLDRLKESRRLFL